MIAIKSNKKRLNIFVHLPVLVLAHVLLLTFANNKFVSRMFSFGSHYEPAYCVLLNNVFLSFYEFLCPSFVLNLALYYLLLLWTIITGTVVRNGHSAALGTFFLTSSTVTLISGPSVPVLRLQHSVRLREVPRLVGAGKAGCTSAFASQNIFFLSLTSVYLLLAGVEGPWFPMITLGYSRKLIGTHLDQGPTCRRDLYLTTHNTHNRQISVTPVGLEPAIPASELPQTYVLVRAVMGIGSQKHTVLNW